MESTDRLHPLVLSVSPEPNLCYSSVDTINFFCRGRRKRCFLFGLRNTFDGITSVIQCNSWFPKSQAAPLPAYLTLCNCFTQRCDLGELWSQFSQLSLLAHHYPALPHQHPQAPCCLGCSGCRQTPVVSPSVPDRLGSLSGKSLGLAFCASQTWLLRSAGCSYLHLPQGSTAFLILPRLQEFR